MLYFLESFLNHLITSLHINLLLFFIINLVKFNLSINYLFGILYNLVLLNFIILKIKNYYLFMFLIFK